MKNTQENTLLGDAIRNLNISTIELHEIGLTGFADDVENIVHKLKAYYESSWDDETSANENLEPMPELEFQHKPGQTIGVWQGGM